MTLKCGRSEKKSTVENQRFIWIFQCGNKAHLRRTIATIVSEIDDNFQGLFLNFVMQSVITAGTLYFAAAKTPRLRHFPKI